MHHCIHTFDVAVLGSNGWLRWACSPFDRVARGRAKVGGRHGGNGREESYSSKHPVMGGAAVRFD